VLESREKGAKVKRIVVLLSVVAMMVGMLAMSVAPAFALQRMDLWGCRVSDKFYTHDESIYPGSDPDRNGDGKYCSYMNWDTGKWRNADNRPL
jgi:hypothetical protein